LWDDFKEILHLEKRVVVALPFSLSCGFVRDFSSQGCRAFLAFSRLVAFAVQWLVFLQAFTSPSTNFPLAHQH